MRGAFEETTCSRVGLFKLMPNSTADMSDATAATMKLIIMKNMYPLLRNVLNLDFKFDFSMSLPAIIANVTDAPAINSKATITNTFCHGCGGIVLVTIGGFVVNSLVYAFNEF